MKQVDRDGSGIPQWLFPIIIGIFLILAIGTAYISYKIFLSEPEQTGFPKVFSTQGYGYSAIGASVTGQFAAPP